MKRVLTLILAIVMCASLCACGGNRDVASPGAAGNESADGSTNNTTTADGTGNTDNTNTVDDGSGDVAGSETNDDGVVPDTDPELPESAYTEAPEADEEYSYNSGDTDINISYGDGMTVTEETEDDMVSIEYSEQSKLYVQDVTDIYDPSATDPTTFLYDYAYESCVQLVTETFGEISQFYGEFAIETSGNELYGFGAHMACDSHTNVYAFIKLVAVDDGYAVMIGICDETDMNVFDNVVIN